MKCKAKRYTAVKLMLKKKRESDEVLPKKRKRWADQFKDSYSNLFLNYNVGCYRGQDGKVV